MISALSNGLAFHRAAPTAPDWGGGRTAEHDEQQSKARFPYAARVRCKRLLDCRASSNGGLSAPHPCLGGLIQQVHRQPEGCPDRREADFLGRVRAHELLQPVLRAQVHPG
jgi:hypothetical protein